MICPVCDSTEIRGSHPQGYLEKEIYARIFIRPFRCRKCRTRFLRFSLRDESPRRRRKKRGSSGAVPVEGPPENFEELIHEIHHAELETLGNPGKQPHNGVSVADSSHSEHPSDGDPVRSRKESR